MSHSLQSLHKKAYLFHPAVAQRFSLLTTCLMSGESAPVVGDVQAFVTFKTPLSLMLVGVMLLQARGGRKPGFAAAATQGWLVGVVVALLLMRLHLASARRRKVTFAIRALHRSFGRVEYGAAKARRNVLGSRRVNRKALAGVRVLLGMPAGQMVSVLQEGSGVQAALGVARKARV